MSQIKIYTTPTCTYCTMAKNWFRQQDIPFTEFNIARDLKRAEEVMRKTGQAGVPVIDVNGKMIVGFNKPEIERALHR